MLICKNITYNTNFIDELYENSVSNIQIGNKGENTYGQKIIARDKKN